MWNIGIPALLVAAHRGALFVLLLVDAPPLNAEPAAGTGEALSLLLGLVATVAAVVLGIGYWVWRRSRGPLHRADDDVKALGADAAERSDALPKGRADMVR